MKRYTISFILFYLVLLPSILSAQWTRTGGPYGGWVFDLRSNDLYLFAGTENGIYRSHNDGHYWERLTDGLPLTMLCYDLDVEENQIIFFGWDPVKNWAPSYTYQVYTSDDNGDHWSEINLPDTVLYPEQVAIHDSMIFVSENSLLKSTDNGETWTTLLSRQDGFYNSGQHMEIYNDKLYVISLNKVWMTEDWGDTWSKINFPSGCTGYNVFPTDSVLILACEYDAYRSIDNGITWKKASGWQWNNPNEKDIIFQHDTFYVNSAVVLRSVDYGLSWDTLPKASSGFFPYGLTLQHGRLYSNSLSNGIQQFWPPSDDLQIRDFGIDATLIDALSIHDDELWTGVSYNGLYRYDLNTQTWDSLNYFDWGFSIADITWIGENLFIVNDFGEVSRSVDQGHSWSPVYESNFDNVREFVEVDSTLYVVTEYGEVMDKSEDFGETWQPAFPNFHSQTNAYKGYFLPYHGYYFMTTSDNQLFRSSDAGNSWQEINTGISIVNGYIKKLRDLGPYMFMEVYEFDNFSPHEYKLTLYISVDDGLTWSPFMEGLPHLYIYDPTYEPSVDLVYYSDTLVLGTYYDGIYYRSSQDPEWQRLMINNNFPRSANVLALSADKLFVGTEGMGVWQRDASNITPTKEIDSPINILSVTPNPADQQIHIQSDIKNGLGRLYIVDVYGRVILWQEIAEPREFSITIEQFPPGLYSVRLEGSDKNFLGRFIKE